MHSNRSGVKIYNYFFDKKNHRDDYKSSTSTLLLASYTDSITGATSIRKSIPPCASIGIIGIIKLRL
jgi:hypothetical protein